MVDEGKYFTINRARQFGKTTTLHALAEYLGQDYPDLGIVLRDILFCGKGIPFNWGIELVSIGAMFGFFKEEDGQVAIANRIFEILFYNLFIAQDAIDSKTYDAGQQLKGQIEGEVH